MLFMHNYRQFIFNKLIMDANVTTLRVFQRETAFIFLLKLC